MKRYMVFGGDRSKPNGGMHDYLGGSNALDNAKSLGLPSCLEHGTHAFGHIWDITRNQIVATYNPTTRKWQNEPSP